MSIKLNRAFLGALERTLRKRKVHGLMGRRKPDGTYEYDVAGRPGYVWVTIRLSSGAQTAVEANNFKAGVKHARNIAVEMVRDGQGYVIEGKSTRGDITKLKPPDPTGVESHEHGQYIEIGDFIDDSAGVDDAGKPIKTDASGKLDATLIDSEDIADIVGAMVAGNTETDITVTYDDADNTLDFVLNPTLLSDRIHAAPLDVSPLDADEVPSLASDGSFTLLRSTWTTIKAFLKTYFDTLYGRLASANTWAALQTFSSGISLGNETLTVYDEGTWTPIITGSTGNPTLTYTTQVGRYTRIGNVVSYNFVVAINTISVAGSGDVRISIPFIDGSSSGCPGVLGFAGINLAGAPVSTEFRTRNGGAFGRVIGNQNNGAQVILQHTDIASGDSFIACGFFFI